MCVNGAAQPLVFPKVELLLKGFYVASVAGLTQLFNSLLYLVELSERNEKCGYLLLFACRCLLIHTNFLGAYYLRNGENKHTFQKRRVIESATINKPNLHKVYCSWEIK
jgi:hypothetical protein